MPSFEFQQVYEKVVEKLDAPDASKPPQEDKRVQHFTEEECREQITRGSTYYSPQVDTKYRK